MNFLVDAQLPPALSQFLRKEQQIAKHVAEIGMKNEKDSLIWNYALKTGATIITKDEDFATRIQLRPDGPAVVWIRVGNCSNRALLKWFAPLWSDILADLKRGEKLIEIV